MTKNIITEHCWEPRYKHFVARVSKTKMRGPHYKMRQTCMLPAGHDGPHAWTPDDEIVIGLRKGKVSA